jgi:hypothetical protein
MTARYAYGLISRRGSVVRAGIVVGAGVLVLASCASSPTPKPRVSTASVRSGVPVAPLPTEGSPPAGSSTANQARARAEAARLVAAARLPAGSVRLPSGPAVLSAPALGTPAASSLIDTVQFWRLPLSAPAAGAWLVAHPPRGLSASGSARQGGPSGVTATGWAYSAPDGPGWVQAALDEGVAAQGASASVLRLDGLTLWLDPRPEIDTATGPRLRVDVVTGCPTSDAGQVGVHNTDAPTSGLLPAGAPTAALVCRYHGGNGTEPFRLSSQRRLAAAPAGRLAAAARGASLAHLDGSVRSCPAMDGGAIALAFSYPNRPDLDLWYSVTGCPYVANGAILSETTDPLVTALSTLAP